MLCLTDEHRAAGGVRRHDPPKPLPGLAHPLPRVPSRSPGLYLPGYEAAYEGLWEHAVEVVKMLLGTPLMWIGAVVQVLAAPFLTQLPAGASWSAMDDSQEPRLLSAHGRLHMASCSEH